MNKNRDNTLVMDEIRSKTVTNNNRVGLKNLIEHFYRIASILQKNAMIMYFSIYFIRNSRTSSETYRTEKIF